MHFVGALERLGDLLNVVAIHSILCKCAVLGLEDLDQTVDPGMLHLRRKRSPVSGHQAHAFDQDAILFSINDRPVIQTLGFWREEAVS